MLQYFVEDQIGYWNWEGFASDDYEALLTKARVTTDAVARGEIYQKMQTLLEDSSSFVFISQEPTVILHRDTIIPGILPDGRPVFHAFKKAE